jgi:hypothetical protein
MAESRTAESALANPHLRLRHNLIDLMGPMGPMGQISLIDLTNLTGRST